MAFASAVLLLLCAHATCVTAEVRANKFVRNQRTSMSVSPVGDTLREEDPIALQTKDIGEDGPEINPALRRVLMEVEEMARKKETPQSDKIKIIKDIVDQELLPDLVKTHDAAETQVKTHHTAVKQCNLDGTENIKKIATTTEVTVGQTGTKHSECRGVEKDKETTKDTLCGKLDAFLDSINSPSDLPTNRPRNQMVTYVKTMSDYYCPKGPTVKDLNANCKHAEKEHASQRESCDQSQAQFESGFCTWRTQLTDGCDALKTCYDDAVNAYNDYVTATKTLVKKWKVEYAALKKITCYTDVWMNDNDAKTVDASQLNKCNTDVVDTSPMDITYPEVPAKAECDMTAVKVYPGDAGFSAAEYSKFTKYANEVIACVGAGSTVTASPTAAPTPTVTEKMVFAGNGCCRFDGWRSPDPRSHGYITEDECKDKCMQDENCIMADVRDPNGKTGTTHCFTYYGSGANFKLGCNTTNPDEKCFKKQ